MDINLLGQILTIATTIVEAVGLVILTKTFLTPRYTMAISFAVAFVLVFTIATLSGNFIEIGYVKAALSIAVGVLINFILFQGSPVLKIVLAVLNYLLLLIMEWVPMVLSMMVTKENLEGLFSNVIAVSYGIVLSRIIYFVIVEIIHNAVKGKELRNMAVMDWVLILAIPVVTIVVFFGSFWNSVQSGKIGWLTVITLICLLFLDMIMFYIIERFARQYEMKKTNMMLNQQMIYVKENIENLTETHQKIRRLSHDFNGHIACISGLLDSGCYEQAQEYVKKLSQASKEASLPIKTQNMTIDALLNQKYFKAEERKIRFEIRTNSLLELKVDVFDFVTILTNTIDNAIEACSRVKEPARQILLEIENHPDCLKLRITNTVSQRVPIKDGMPHTTKKDEKNHGIGLLSVKRAVEKYDGELMLDSTDTEFQVAVLL